VIKDNIRKALLDFSWDNYGAELPPLEDEDGEDTDLLRDLVELLAGTAIRSLV